MSAIFPSLYLAPVEYYRLLANENDIVIEKWEYFEKRTLRNRCYIYGANGVLPLIIPVKHTGKVKMPMKDIKICNDFNWQKIHWKSIEAAYRSAPYFEFYEEDIAPFYREKFRFLFDFNEGLREVAMEWLSIRKNINYSDEYLIHTLLPAETENTPNDFRKRFNKRDKTSISGERTLKTNYTQVFESKMGFIPNLSIIDLLFNEGKDAANFLLL